MTINTAATSGAVYTFDNRRLPGTTVRNVDGLTIGQVNMV
jgi:hypothetical protein